MKKYTEDVMETDSLHLQRPTFTLPMLRPDEYMSRRDGCSSLERAMGIVYALVRASYVPTAEGSQQLCALNAMMRKQLNEALLYGPLIRVQNEREGQPVLRNITEAVFHAEEEWEVAHVITPHLISIDDGGMDDAARVIQAVSLFIRHKIAV